MEQDSPMIAVQVVDVWFALNSNKKKTVSVLFPLDDYLGQEGASDKDLHQHGEDQLDDEEDNCGRTFLCDAAETVANGCLGLQGEEEGPCQSLHLHDAGRVVGWGLELCRGMFKKKYTCLVIAC